MVFIMLISDISNLYQIHGMSTINMQLIRKVD